MIHMESVILDENIMKCYYQAPARNRIHILILSIIRNKFANYPNFRNNTIGFLEL